MGIYRRWVNTTRKVQFQFPNYKFQPWEWTTAEALLAARQLDFWISQHCAGEAVVFTYDMGATEDLYDEAAEWPNEYELAVRGLKMHDDLAAL